MTRAIVFAGAFVVALWLLGRRPARDEWLVINWRDLEQVDSV